MNPRDQNFFTAFKINSHVLKIGINDFPECIQNLNAWLREIKEQADTSVDVKYKEMMLDLIKNHDQQYPQFAVTFKDSLNDQLSPAKQFEKIKVGAYRKDTNVKAYTYVCPINFVHALGGQRDDRTGLSRERIATLISVVNNFLYYPLANHPQFNLSFDELRQLKNIYDLKNSNQARSSNSTQITQYVFPKNQNRESSESMPVLIEDSQFINPKIPSMFQTPDFETPQIPSNPQTPSIFKRPNFANQFNLPSSYGSQVRLEGFAEQIGSLEVYQAPPSSYASQVQPSHSSGPQLDGFAEQLELLNVYQAPPSSYASQVQPSHGSEVRLDGFVEQLELLNVYQSQTIYNQRNLEAENLATIPSTETTSNFQDHDSLLADIARSVNLEELKKFEGKNSKRSRPTEPSSSEPKRKAITQDSNRFDTLLDVMRLFDQKEKNSQTPTQKNRELRQVSRVSMHDNVSQQILHSSTRPINSQTTPRVARNTNKNTNVVANVGPVASHTHVNTHRNASQDYLLDLSEHIKNYNAESLGNLIAAPRQHQIEFNKGVQRILANGLNVGYINVATGGGKSYMIGMLIKMLIDYHQKSSPYQDPDFQILVVVPWLPLTEQIAETFREKIGIDENNIEFIDSVHNKSKKK